MNKKHFILLLLGIICTGNTFSQNAERTQLDPSRFGVVYDVPATMEVKVTANVTYVSDSKGSFALDIYSLPNAKAGDKFPAVIFLTANKDMEGYKSFARLVAAHGMIGIAPNSDVARTQELVQALFAFIEREGTKYGIDATRLGVFSGSANVPGGAQYLMGPNASKGIKAAALYYGSVPNVAYRKDLPVLFFVSEGDARKGQQYGSLWQKIIDAHAPWTIMYGSRMPHAFDIFTDTDDARRNIQQTIAFWKTHLEPVPQPNWKPSLAREVMGATFDSDPQRALDLLSRWIAENPKDAFAYNQRGRFLIQLRRLDEAGIAYEKALELGGNDSGTLYGIGQVRNQQKRYEEAVNYLEKAIGAGARFGGSYSQLAAAQTSLNRPEDAIKTYERAVEAGVMPKGTASYNIACVYSLSKQTDKAFEWLNKALDEGFTDRRLLETDTDLASVRLDSRFQTLLTRLPRAAS